MKSNVIIRPAVLSDCRVLYDLICELAIFENAPDEVSIGEDVLREDIFGASPILKVSVAEMSGEVVGAAMYYEKYSTWKGRSLHLEDLIVSESHRGKGIGAALFESVMHICVREGYARMDWQVLDWNESAIVFYEKYGADISDEWLNGRLNLDAITRWCENNKV